MTTAAETADLKAGIVRESLFAQESVKSLRESDFALDDKDLITIKYTDCMLVLFYTNNVESSELTQIWGLAAAEAVGPIFAACNLKLERKVAQAFNKLNSEPTSLKWGPPKGHGPTGCDHFGDTWRATCFLSKQPAIKFSICWFKIHSYEVVTEWLQPERLRSFWEIRTEPLALSKQPGSFYERVCPFWRLVILCCITSCLDLTRPL